MTWYVHGVGYCVRCQKLYFFEALGASGPQQLAQLLPAALQALPGAPGVFPKIPIVARLFRLEAAFRECDETLRQRLEVHWQAAWGMLGAPWVPW